ncbi:MAG: DUF3881 family protein [bacterium]|nr:DUF3881 family protein [bacterium]
MHSYLRAIGFSNVKNQLELDDLIEHILTNPTQNKMVFSDVNAIFAEISMEFADNMGLALRGEYDTEGKFRLESYYPYFFGDTLSTREEILFNKKVDYTGFTGMCDDLRIGVSLIFYLQNVLEYMSVDQKSTKLNNFLDVNLAALSMDGKVLLGIEKQENRKENGMYETKHRTQLIAEARRGNQDAIDSLTIDDIDLYAMITKRSKTEDLYSIVESSFVPYGSESDNYSIIGNIVECRSMKNSMTEEEICWMLVECNDLMFPVIINRKDLQGEPAVGRRFKGVIWMQGSVGFSEI